MSQLLHLLLIVQRLFELKKAHETICTENNDTKDTLAEVRTERDGFKTLSENTQKLLDETRASLTKQLEDTKKELQKTSEDKELAKAGT